MTREADPGYVIFWGCDQAPGGPRLVKVAIPGQPPATQTPVSLACPLGRALISTALLGRKRRPGEPVDATLDYIPRPRRRH